MECFEVEISQKKINKFWNKTKINEETGCLERISHKKGNTYFQMSINKHSVMAHRLAYFLKNGKFDKSLRVCHMCDNKRCINPDHLFLGTSQDNSSDMVNKNRQAFGEKHGMSKLSSEDVFDIRERFAEGESSTVLMREFDCGESTILNIVKGYKRKYEGGRITNRGHDNKLSPDDVREIRRLCSLGVPQRTVQEMFLLKSSCTVSYIVNFKIYKELE